MSQPLRWGILGAAKIARKDVAPAIHAAAHNSLVALASRSPEKVTAFVDRYPGLAVHDSYEDLLADQDIDAVYVPLPNEQHIPWSLKALRAGKHVLCEKPIALKAADLDALVAERDASGLLAAEAFMVVHHPQWQRVKQLLAEGAIGDLRRIAGAFAYNNADEPENIRQKPEHGGGALYDIGVYPVVATRFATGVEPLGSQTKSVYEGGVDTSSDVQIDFGEFSLDFYCSMRLALRQEMVFHGTTGWLRLQAPFNAGSYDDPIIELRNESGRSIERFAGVDQYQLMVEAFQRAVGGAEEFPCSLEFSKANQQVIDQLLAQGKASKENFSRGSSI